MQLRKQRTAPVAPVAPRWPAKVAGDKCTGYQDTAAYGLLKGMWPVLILRQLLQTGRPDQPYLWGQ